MGFFFLPNNSHRNKGRLKKAEIRARKYGEIIKAYKEAGMTLEKIADKMTADGITNPFSGVWTSSSVRHYYKRFTDLEKKAAERD